MSEFSKSVYSMAESLSSNTNSAYELSAVFEQESRRYNKSLDEEQEAKS